MEKYRTSCVLCQNNQTLFELFHDETSLNSKTIHSFNQSISKAFDTNDFMEEIRSAYDIEKPASQNIPLQAQKFEEDEFLSVLQSRESTRCFSDKCVAFNTFSNILRYSYGRSKNNRYTIPSAGGTYPIKLIVVVNRVESLNNGIYEYHLKSQSLIPLLTTRNIEYEKITNNLEFARECAFSIHLIGSPLLICYKYQDRGYRFMNIECGHIAQNLSLVAQKFHISSVCSGGYADGEFIDYINKINQNKYKHCLSLYEIFFGYA